MFKYLYILFLWGDDMEKVLYIKNKKHKLNLLSLIGSFVFFAAILGLIVAISDLYSKSQATFELKQCYKKANQGDVSVNDCQTSFYRKTGISLSMIKLYPDSADNIKIIFPPIYEILLWIALSLFGILLFNLDT